MSESTADDPDSRRSWLIAGLGGVAMIFTFGTPFSYGVLRGPIGASFDITPLLLSGVFAVMLVTFFIGAAAVAMLTVGFSARAVILGNAGLVSLVAPGLYVVESAVGLTIVLSLHGLAVGTVFMTLAGVIPRWFHSQRGVATGVIMAGNGLGLFLVPPLWQVAIAWIEVQLAFLAISIATAMTFLLAGLVCRRPDWTETSPMRGSDVGQWLSTLARKRTFQLLFIGIGVGWLWYLMFAAYAVDLLMTRGLSATGASIAFGLVGGVSITSRLGGGIVADRVGVRRTYLVSLGIASLGTALLVVPHFSVLVLSIVCMGVGLGGLAALFIPLLMEVFSQSKDTAVVGLFSAPTGIFALTAPTSMTLVVNMTGSFTPAILLTFASTLVAIGLVAAGTT